MTKLFTTGILVLPDGTQIELDSELGWITDSPELLADLNASYPTEDNPTLDYSPSNPSPLYDLLLQVQKVIGGEITAIPVSTAPPGTIF